MRAKKLRTKVVGLVAAVMVVGAPLTAWAIDVAGGDLYYNGGQTDTIVYSEIGRKAGISRNYMDSCPHLQVLGRNGRYSSSQQQQPSFPQFEKCPYRP